MQAEEIIDSLEAEKFVKERAAITWASFRAALYRKEIPFFKVGRRLRFRRSDLITWIDSKISRSN